MATASDLHTAIAAVCPIDGVAIGDPADKATWRIDFKDGASGAQKAAAIALLQNFDLAAPGQVQITLEDVLATFTPQQLAQVRSAAQAREAKGRPA